MKNIAVLTSGGVDSSVALKLLKDEGYNLTAFYIKIWIEDLLEECPWKEDLKFVESVTKKMNVPLEVVSLQREYWESVIKYTLNEVKNGNTPNPDIFCNNLIKFGLFDEKYGKDFDAIATGHYAQISSGNLKIAKDRGKDQTYFLSRLTNRQLKRVIFPIGHLLKSEVRNIARKNDLMTADRPDSQGLCFLGKIKFSDFLKEYIGESKGKIVDADTGETVGEHKGFWFYTIGQREGLGIGGTKKPYYVSDKDAEENIVYVVNGRKNPKLWSETIKLVEVQEMGKIQKGREYLVKIRHPDKGRKGKVTNITNKTRKTNGSVTIRLSEPAFGIAPGQFGVMYDEGKLVGSGKIV